MFAAGSKVEFLISSGEKREGKIVLIFLVAGLESIYVIGYKSNVPSEWEYIARKKGQFWAPAGSNKEV